MGKPSLDDYIDVAERIATFKAAHPQGSLQRLGDPYVLEVGNKAFVVYTAAAYRHPDDPRPGIGTAWELVPGPTPYTKDSELMNAETAAWGRAIVALGFAASGKIASRQEVQARQEPAEPKAATVQPTPAQPVAPTATPKPASGADTDAERVSAKTLDELRTLATLAKVDQNQLKWMLVALKVENVEDLTAAMEGLTPAQADALGNDLQKVVEDAAK
jgi:hypothetical protein